MIKNKGIKMPNTMIIKILNSIKNILDNKVSIKITKAEIIMRISTILNLPNISSPDL